jgi:membrane fusion protein, multidrug efflux system
MVVTSAGLKNRGEIMMAQKGEEVDKEAGHDVAAQSRVRSLLHDCRFIAVVSGIAIIAGVLFWRYSTLWESTDDAQVDGHLAPVSARISGQVTQVNFEDNQFVRKGSVLVRIDRTDYEVAYERVRSAYANALAVAGAARTSVPVVSTTTASSLASARAKVDNARSAVVAAEKQLDAARARIREAQANDDRDKADLRRNDSLIARGVISRQTFDQVVARAAASAASLDAATATLNSVRQQVVQARGEVARAEADLQAARTAPEQVAVSIDRAKSAEAAAGQAKAALEQARLNLDYTSVTAPVDGIVGRKSVEPGQNVQPGQVLFTVVPLDDIWVTANFKETQLRYMRPGQRVEIRVDAYGKTYAGHVESIGGASGSRFSLFPPENATGNYVKVVQRIPVRIRFDKGQDSKHLLRPGMSVVPTVRVQ